MNPQEYAALVYALVAYTNSRPGNPMPQMVFPSMLDNGYRSYTLSAAHLADLDPPLPPSEQVRLVTQSMSSQGVFLSVL